MTQKERQIRNSFIYLIPSAVGCLLPFITLPIFTRILTPEDYGVFALAQVYALFMSGLSNFGMTISYERNYFQYSQGQKAAELLYSTLVFVITNLLLFGWITFLFREKFSEWIFGSMQYKNILFLAYCSAGILSLKNYFLIYYKNSEYAKNYVSYAVCDSIFAVILSLILVAGLRMGVAGLIGGQLLSGFVLFVIVLSLFLRKMPLAWNKNILIESIKLSYPLTPRLLFKVVGTQFDKYMLGLISTMGSVGFYSIGQKVANLGFVIMTAIGNVFSPQVYKKMFDLKEEGGKAIGVYLTPFLYISILFCLMIVLFSEEVIRILTPSAYHGAIEIVMVLTMSYGFMFFGKQPQLIYKKKTFLISVLTFFNIGLNIILIIPFIKMWGAIGAAWAMFLGSIIAGGVSFYISQRYYYIEWEYKRIIQIFVIFFGSATMLLFLRYNMVGYPQRLSIKMLSLAIYIYLGMRLDIVSKAKLQLVQKSLLNKFA